MKVEIDKKRGIGKKQDSKIFIIDDSYRKSDRIEKSYVEGMIVKREIRVLDSPIWEVGFSNDSLVSKIEPQHLPRYEILEKKEMNKIIKSKRLMKMFKKNNFVLVKKKEIDYDVGLDVKSKTIRFI